MSRLLEILGRAITVDTADLIWHWFEVVGLGGDSAGTPEYQKLERALALMAESKTDQAEEQLRLYLFENPACVRGRLAAAAICLHKNQLNEAVEQLNSVYLRQPSNTMALYALGHCYERLGRESEAVAFYQDCLKFKNYLQLPRQRLAAIYFKNSQMERTIQEYELLKDEYPDDIPTLITLGHLYTALSQYDRAVDAFNTAILAHPDNFNSDDDEINQLIRTGRLEQAAAHLEELLHDQPERTDLIIRYADILRMLGAVDEAVLQYEQATQICPNSLETTIKLGTQYLGMGDEKLAAKQFNRAVEINDRIVDAYFGLTVAQKLAGNASDALGTLSLAAAIDANSSLLFAETAALKFRIKFIENSLSCDPHNPPGVIETVIAAHRHQIAARPQNPDLYYRLGILLMSVGRASEAAELFGAALKINPAHTRAASKLVIALFEINDTDTALRHLTAPDCLGRDTLELHYRTALLYCDRIRFASSLINLEHYMENNFTSADPTVNISIVLQNLGLLDRADIMWDNLSDTASAAMDSGYLFPSD